jgi:hypothetical protein
MKIAVAIGYRLSAIFTLGRLTCSESLFLACGSKVLAFSVLRFSLAERNEEQSGRYDCAEGKSLTA